MANLQVKEINPAVYGALKEQAKRHNRSVSQEVVTIIRNFLARRQKNQGPSGAEVLLGLAGAWDDQRSADAIVKDLKKSRRNSNLSAFD